MALDIPINIDSIQVSAIAIPTKTPQIDFTTNRIMGYCNDLIALQQFIKFALLTPRFRFLIYNNQYGSETETLVASNYEEALFYSEAKRLVKEALLSDERIKEVYAFDFSGFKEERIIRFSVDTIFGTLHGEEVSIDV